MEFNRAWMPRSIVMAKKRRNEVVAKKADPLTKKELVSLISSALWILHDLYKIFTGSK